MLKRMKTFLLIFLFLGSSICNSFEFIKNNWKQISIGITVLYLGWRIYKTRVQEDKKDDTEVLKDKVRDTIKEEINEIVKYNFGVQSIKGRRQEMEDTWCASQIDKYNYFGVFDGHNGYWVAEFVARNLHHYIHKNLGAFVPVSIITAFLETNSSLKSLMENHVDLKNDVGSTAIIAMIDDKMLHVANLGDCRAVISSSGEAKEMSSDHTLKNMKEAIRVSKEGAEIIPDPIFRKVFRVNGYLIPTRSFGDWHCKGISFIPEIKSWSLASDCEFLILASDGLWDVIENQEAVDIVTKVFDSGRNPQTAAKILVEHALKKYSSDNITAIVIDLKK